MRRLACLVGMFAASAAWAADPVVMAPVEPKPAAPGAPVAPEDAAIQPELKDAGSAAAADLPKWGVGAMYLPFDLLLPSKLGLGLFQRASSRGSFWELDYQRGSVSLPFIVEHLGSVGEQRVIARRGMILGSSGFYFGAGLAYFDFSADIGNAILSRLPATANIPQATLLRQRSFGFHLAFGTEFRLHEQWRLMVDWVTWSQPVIGLDTQSDFLQYVTDAGDREKVDTLLTVLKYLPRAGAAGLRLVFLF